MFMLSFIFVIVYDLFEWKRICVVLLLFVYLCLAVRDSLIKKGRVGIPLTGLTRHLVVPVPSQDLNLIFNVLCLALCSVSQVNMRGDCLNFLFIHYYYV